MLQKNQSNNMQSKNIPFQTIDWKNIPIKKVGNRIIYLEDVTKIKFQEAQVNSYHRINGLNSVSLVVISEKGVNTIALAKQVRTIVDGLKDEVHNDGYALKLTRDASEFLSEEIGKIELRTLYSLLILLVLILIINRSFKYLAVLLLSIMANLSIAAIFYYILDVELHMYSFAGITISFGISSHFNNYRGINDYFLFKGSTTFKLMGFCFCNRH